MKILAIGAHPDDIEFGCAPLLIQEIQAGAEVRMLVLSRGEAGTAGTPEQRTEEAHAAARLIGATLDFMDFRGDCLLEATPANAMRVAADIRRFQPTIVLAPNPAPNQHPDHAAAGLLTRDACRLARYGGLRELHAHEPHKVAQLYFYDITQHGTRSPDLVLDITAVVPVWQKVMDCHASQTSSRSYIELQMTAARLLGLTIGVDYAAGVYVNEPVRLERLSDLRLSARNF